MIWAALMDDRGQDLVEYSLLLAFVALAAAGAMLTVGTDINTLWGIANTRLSDASN